MKVKSISVTDIWSEGASGARSRATKGTNLMVVKLAGGTVKCREEDMRVVLFTNIVEREARSRNRV